MLKSRIETIETGLKSMQGMNPAFATSRGLGLGEVLLFVSLGGVDGRPRISPSLPRLRWRRFWHACCIVGAAAHVARLHFSGDHLEDVWNLWRNILVSAGYMLSGGEIRKLQRLPRSGIFIFAYSQGDSRCFVAEVAQG